MPRQGLGMPIVSGASNAPVTVIDDVLWEDFGGSGGEIAVNYQETRTNVVLHSQDTTDAEAWNKSNTAIDSTLYEAPDNSTTANAIKSNSTGEKSYSITQSNLSVTAGKTYTASVHLKKDALGFAKLRFNDETINYSSTFNLTTGANVQTGNLIGTPNKTSVDTMDDGWFRCSMTFQAQNTTSSGFLRVSAQADASTATPNIAVSGIVLIYVWGFQLEESIEATSYIVTTTSARTATTTLNDTSDVWDFDGADLMPEADPDSEGVWEEGSNLVLNGDYEDLGSEEVTNGDFSQIGSEEVTNGDFDSGSNWSTPTGWEIIDGKLKGTNVNAVSSTQGGHTFLNKSFKVVYTVSDYVQGDVRIYLGGTQQTPNRSANGTYTEYITITTANTTLYIQGVNNFTGSIENISVKEVGQDWSFGATWSMGDGVANYEGGSNAPIIQNISLPSGKSYNIKFDVSNASGNASIWIGNGAGGVNYFGGTYAPYANGSYSLYFTMPSTQSTLAFYGASSGSNFTIDNISLKQVDPNDRWSFDSGWSIEDGKAVAVAPDASGFSMTQTGIMTAGVPHEVTFTVSERTAGNVRFRVNPVNGTTRSADGTYTEIITPESSNFAIQGLNSFVGKIDNVTVREYAIQPQDV